MTLNELNMLAKNGFITDISLYEKLKNNPELLAKTKVCDVTTQIVLPKFEEVEEIAPAEPIVEPEKEEEITPVEPIVEPEKEEEITPVEPVVEPEKEEEIEDSPIVVEEIEEKKSSKK